MDNQIITVNYPKPLKGFTLIELSIVLVIIGLILAGVLVGQDLIRSAEARAILTQVDKLNSAVNAFKNKFGALPGDYSQAVTYIQPSSPSVTITNGDGNGLIAPGIPSAVVTALSSTSENAALWAHLGAENLVEGTYSGSVTQTTLGGNFPLTANKKGGIIGYAFTDQKNYWHIGLANSPAASTTIVTGDNVSPNNAMQIDSKTDDGMPDSGIIVARGGTVLEGAATAGAMASNSCKSNAITPNVYNSSAGSAILCQLRLQMM